MDKREMILWLVVVGSIAGFAGFLIGKHLGSRETYSKVLAELAERGIIV